MSRFKAVISSSSSIIEAIRKMSASPENNYIAGISVIVDDQGRVSGVLTDGDIRRGLSKGISIDESVEMIANFNPVMVTFSDSVSHMKSELIRISRKRDIDYKKYSSVILVDESGKLYDVVEISTILEPDVSEKIIAVYGMGFVGLTLAATLANSGFIVLGIDTNKAVVDSLKNGIPTFHEEGLESLVSSLLKKRQISFTSNSDEDADIHIVSVGTPISDNSKPDNSFIIDVSRTISRKLKTGDLVIFRSTVPVGTIRHLVLPILEESGLVAGKDFLVSFAPERTVEGNALEELRTLPQIIGGLDQESYEESARVFTRITNTIVEAESLEAAEMVKLLNNTFRDVVFSFSNEVAKICDELNINSFKLIEAANEGYPRNRIPAPSPGVGGLCLSKDPYLYTNPHVDLSYKPILGLASRKINSSGHQYVYKKIEDFCKLTSKNIKSLKIFLIGLAFKGEPETSDIRDSMSMSLVEILPARDNIYIKDFVVSSDDIFSTGCHCVESIEDGFHEADVVLVMNNHHMNRQFNISSVIDKLNKPALFFDGWNMFNQSEIENTGHVYYSTMGYLSSK